MGRERSFTCTDLDIRMSRNRAIPLLACFVAASAMAAADHVIDFEKGSPGWTYYGGFEFPGATGSIATTRESAREGKQALRLSGDFSGGGRYVAATCALPEGTPCLGLRFWVRTTDVDSIGIRIVDSGGQTFQFTRQLTRKDAWQEVVLQDITEPKVVWGGAGDKVFHQPAASCSFTVGVGPKKTTALLLDAVQVLGAPAAAKR